MTVNFALKDSDINPQDDLVWFVGDAISDIECAYRSHCQPILFGNHMIEMNSYSNVQYIDNHDIFIEYIQEISN